MTIRVARGFWLAGIAALATCLVAIAQPAPAQYEPQTAELDNLVARIAIYPDSLLSQILAASTFPEQIPEAAQWADEHAYLQGDALAHAIEEDQLPWDPAVEALLPFRSVLAMMSTDMSWTSQLGNAFLQDPAAVMDAVQRRRHEAERFGYLHSNGQIVVSDNGPYVEIDPVDPAFVPVPAYDPGVVFAAPRPGFEVGGALNFGSVSIGAAFAPWGWGHSRFAWDRHGVIIANHPWDRRWENRRDYVHPYDGVRRWEQGHRVERHQTRHDDRRP